MKVTKTSLAFLAVAGMASAGTMPMPAPAPMAPAADLFGPGWSVSPYAVYLTPDSDLDGEIWGGGIAAHYFFNAYVGAGLFAQWAEVSTDRRSDEIGGVYAAELILRYPVGTYFAPYITGAGGVQDFGSTEIVGQAGAGVEVKFTPSFGVFGEWDYVFPGGGGGDDDFEDYQAIRFGARFSF